MVAVLLIMDNTFSYTSQNQVEVKMVMIGVKAFHLPALAFTDTT